MSTRNYDFWVEWPRARLPVPDPSDRGIVRSEGEFGKSRRPISSHGDRSLPPPVPPATACRNGFASRMPDRFAVK